MNKFYCVITGSSSTVGVICFVLGLFVGIPLSAKPLRIGIIGLEKSDHAAIALKAGVQSGVRLCVVSSDKAPAVEIADYTPRSDTWAERLLAFENAVGEGCTLIFFMYKCTERSHGLGKLADRAGVTLISVMQPFLSKDCGGFGPAIFAKFDEQGNAPLAGLELAVLKDAEYLKPYSTLLFLRREDFLSGKQEPSLETILTDEIYTDPRIMPSLLLVEPAYSAEIRTKLDRAKKEAVRLLSVGWGPSHLLDLDAGTLEILAWYDYEEVGRSAMKRYCSKPQSFSVGVGEVSVLRKADAAALLKKWEAWLAEPAR